MKLSNISPTHHFYFRPTSIFFDKTTTLEYILDRRTLPSSPHPPSLHPLISTIDKYTCTIFQFLILSVPLAWRSSLTCCEALSRCEFGGNFSSLVGHCLRVAILCLLWKKQMVDHCITHSLLSRHVFFHRNRLFVNQEQEDRTQQTHIHLNRNYRPYTYIPPCQRISTLSQTTRVCSWTHPYVDRTMLFDKEKEGIWKKWINWRKGSAGVLTLFLLCVGWVI